jgi:inorganic phosphate transporter, PiT family
MTIAILLMVVALAAANGANDVSKGVATLAGAGVTRYRTAILWGALTTLVGCLLSIELGRAMGALFSKGIVSAEPTQAFALAVLVGATSWVALASVLRLPVSTTHSIVGSLVGAGLLLAPNAVRWSGVAQKVVLPLLLSIGVAYLIALVLSVLARALSRPRVAARRDGPGAMTATEQPADDVPTSAYRLVTLLHWVSSGTTSCARGLNDNPKIAAIGGFALIPAGFTSNQVALTVAGAMLLGCLFGIRVAKTLGEGVLRMTHGEGCWANVTTSFLVGMGATMGLPMSTTQVSSGAIIGSAGTQVGRLNRKTIRDFLIAWSVTPIFSGLVAAATMFIAS